MGRVYDNIEMDGKELHALFDSGAIRSYITKKAILESNIKIIPLKGTFETRLGGKSHKIKEKCSVEGKLRDKFVELTPYVVSELGNDKNGKEIDLLFGTMDMQIWNIKIDLEKEALDLSRFREEFVEY